MRKFMMIIALVFCIVLSTSAQEENYGIYGDGDGFISSIVELKPNNIEGFKLGLRLKYYNLEEDIKVTLQLITIDDTNGNKTTFKGKEINSNNIVGFMFGRKIEDGRTVAMVDDDGVNKELVLEEYNMTYSINEIELSFDEFMSILEGNIKLDLLVLKSTVVEDEAPVEILNSDGVIKELSERAYKILKFLELRE
ncbi:hypothetical protein CTI16_11700 [Prevotella intermedia]|uniref:Lipocalin-like domain-containing protein n=1 Tax=Prevotella intermedia TaxID=28131 RepID=A0AAJ3RHI1_PREIN|nr:hypothetical protein [Prevotella intermedia]PIK16861.1 hypothetical protein CTI16_11700 [Prevotella intermedia]